MTEKSDLDCKPQLGSNTAPPPPPVPLPRDTNAYFGTSCHSCKAGLVPPVRLFWWTPCRAARTVIFMTVRARLETQSLCFRAQGPRSAHCPGKVNGVRWSFVRGSKTKEWRMTLRWSRDLVPSWKTGRARRDSHTHTHTHTHACNSDIQISRFITVHLVPWATRNTSVSRSWMCTDQDKLCYVCAFGWQDLCIIITFEIFYFLFLFF